MGGGGGYRFPYGLLSDECNNNFITKHLLMP